MSTGFGLANSSATTEAKGMHSDKEAIPARIVDASEVSSLPGKADNRLEARLLNSCHLGSALVATPLSYVVAVHVSC